MKLLNKAAENQNATRMLSKKCKVSKDTIFRNKKKLGLKRYHRNVKPRYTEKQLRKIPGKCRKLRQCYLKGETVIIMDDVKYFTFSNISSDANKGFYTGDKSSTPNDVKFIYKAKSNRYHIFRCKNVCKYRLFIVKTHIFHCQHVCI